MRIAFTLEIPDAMLPVLRQLLAGLVVLSVETDPGSSVSVSSPAPAPSSTIPNEAASLVPASRKRPRDDATRLADKLRKRAWRAAKRDASRTGPAGQVTGRGGTDCGTGGTPVSRAPENREPSECDSGEIKELFHPSLSVTAMEGQVAGQDAGQTGQRTTGGREGGTLFDLGPKTAPSLVPERVRAILAAGMPAVMPDDLDAFRRVLDRLCEAGYAERDFVVLAEASRAGLPGYRSTIALGAMLGRYRNGEYPAGGLRIALEKARAWKRAQARERVVRVAPVPIAACDASVPTVPALAHRAAMARKLIDERDGKGVSS